MKLSYKKIKVATHHGMKKLHVIGDSKVVIFLVRETYASKNKLLKQYRNFVCDQIVLFDAFSISWMERNQNKIVDLLENVAIKPKDISFSRISEIKEQNWASIPDNIENLQVFKDDREILNFFSSEDK